MFEYRSYDCTVCGHSDKIQTNLNEGKVLHYCKNCSWKGNFAGADKSHFIPALGNHTYREFTLGINESKTMINENTSQRIRNIVKMKECLSPEGKKKMVQLLNHFKKLVKEQGGTGNIGGETDIVNPDNFVSEDSGVERNAVAKTFDTEADFDTYVNQHRGIQLTPKELQAIVGFKSAKPTQQDKFFVRYENTDSFGVNDTTVIKKMQEGQQFCWTAFSKHEQASEENQPEDTEGGQEITANDKIRITKSITFTNDVEGSNLLGDFLRKLDI